MTKADYWYRRALAPMSESDFWRSFFAFGNAWSIERGYGPMPRIKIDPFVKEMRRIHLRIAKTFLLPREVVDP